MTCAKKDFNNMIAGYQEDKDDTIIDLTKQICPIADGIVRVFAEKVDHPAVILSHPLWLADFKRLSAKYDFSVREWDENHSASILSGISEFKVVVIALPKGEDELAKKVAEFLEIKNVKIIVLRLLRDIFLQITLRLGGTMIPQQKWPRCAPGSPSYFIFAIPRSGSTFFGDILGKTNKLGYPMEHLLIEQLPVFFNTDLTFNEWIRALTYYSSTPNGFSGTKIISHLFLLILKYYRDNKPELMENLLNFFREYPIIYLKRMNKVRQAVSLLKANKSSVWHVRDNKKILSQEHDENLTAGPTEIENTMLWLHLQEQSLEEFFRLTGCECRTYFYEDFADESVQQNIFREVIELLKIDYRDTVPKTRYSILSDEYNETLVTNYYDYLEKQMREPFRKQEPLVSGIISSLMAEMSKLNKEKQLGKNKRKSSQNRWWKFRKKSKNIK